ncbi:MAG: phosphoglycerate dehydrogenase, partial [Spirochaetia bacterium]|nr:phosphoglycerate dehydrogenase [Spirochaetia bacterium]
IPEASRRGVIVMNSPGGNSVSTAEHAIALLFSLARNIPQAHGSMKGGKWEKSKFVGVELTGKTLGVVGLGRIGKEVVKRARGLKMNVLGYDPFIPVENLAHLEIPIVSKEEILKQCDFITVHTPLTETTKDFISMENLATVKKGIRLINCARGGIYNEKALEEGLKNGQIAGVALDVFPEEPPPADYALRAQDKCVMTPHLGASTGDAEFAVSMETVDQVVEYFETGVARYALNFPTLDPDAMDFLRPYFQGGEKIGRMMGLLAKGDIATVELDYAGEISAYMVQPVTTSILRGALSPALGNEVNFVNAPFLAKDRGIQVKENKRKDVQGFSSAVGVVFKTSQGVKFEVTFTTLHKEAVVVSMAGMPIEFRPEGILVMIENRDVPRVVGTLGMFLGDHNVNIAALELSRDVRGGKARTVITIDELLPSESLDKLARLENIISAVQVDLR